MDSARCCAFNTLESHAVLIHDNITVKFHMLLLLANAITTCSCTHIGHPAATPKSSDPFALPIYRSRQNIASQDHRKWQTMNTLRANNSVTGPYSFYRLQRR